jgi:hypothetical protein
VISLYQSIVAFTEVGKYANIYDMKTVRSIFLGKLDDKKYVLT